MDTFACSNQQYEHVCCLPCFDETLPALGGDIQSVVGGRWMFHGSRAALTLGYLLDILIVPCSILAVLNGTTTLFDAALKLGRVKWTKNLSVGRFGCRRSACFRDGNIFVGTDGRAHRSVRHGDAEFEECNRFSFNK